MKRRYFLQASLLALPVLAACRSLSSGKYHFDACVTRSCNEISGIPCFDTVTAAIASAPSDGKSPYRIKISRGFWREKLVIDKPNIHLIGDDRKDCVLSFDAAAGMLRPDGSAWGTWGCASVIVRAPDFHAENIRIENAFDYVDNLSAPKFEVIGPNGAQAVALMLDVGAERSVLKNVDIAGHQDTLFVDAGRSVFQDCRISGSVDFIFGAGEACFENCEIVSRFRPGKERQGYIAVPSTLETQMRGLIFHRCHLLREKEIPDASVALGRAWRPGKQFADGKYGDPAVLGTAVFLSCWMDAHIDPKGWDTMAYTARDGQRIMLQAETARLYEYDSRGPGALRSPTRRLLNKAQAKAYKM
ncbi:MAG: pectinesterase family protein [Arenimonas sp.]